jgi:MoxR-like ATPase
VTSSTSHKDLAAVFSLAEKVVFGKALELRLAMACLLARGHLLVEDPPGMGKTTFVLALAHFLGLKLSRIQFTNDLLPADVLGANIYDSDQKSFRFHPGPIFSQIVLGDELNRATPKAQSAFLQAMEERSVSIDGVTHSLPEPFFLIATQNPQDHAGTFPLPESQLDRFTLRLRLGPPSAHDEIEIFRQGDGRERISGLPQPLNTAKIIELQKMATQIHSSDSLLQYIQKILAATRRDPRRAGLSPRAGLQLLHVARVWALMADRSFVLPDDVKTVAPYVLGHRIQTGDVAVAEALAQVAVP